MSKRTVSLEVGDIWYLEQLVTPLPEQIKALRLRCGLSQSGAGALVHRTLRNWQQWEKGERAMDLAAWELFNIKAARLLDR